MNYLYIAERIIRALMIFIAGMLVGAFLQWDSDFFFNVGYTQGGA